MDNSQKEELKNKILKGYELYRFQGSRLKRLLKDPFKSLPAYIINVISKIHPFKITYRTLWGDDMHFYLPEGYAIYYYGFFEANLTNFFINFLREGDIFFDVGAHVGFYSVLTSRLVGETGQVHSFEPTPRTFQSLKENMTGKKNSSINNRAVLDKETEIEFTDYGPKYSAFNSFKNRTGEDVRFLPQPEKFNVKTISLDSYCEEKHIVPTLIKIDAEGAEQFILEAMERILSEKRSIITIEVAGGDEWKENCRASIAFLKDRGYVGYTITLEGRLTPHVDQDSYTYDNLVFAHPSNMERIRPLIIS